ncbi:MAG: DUF3011 domain-containing protein [Gloeomargaritaceae cyanobacterium C42_A2020_066]|nr:DUF3011 domain-containing protein [Gloeomargaritaceae cyanobacterium C42_A2020_066]
MDRQWWKTLIATGLVSLGCGVCLSPASANIPRQVSCRSYSENFQRCSVDTRNGVRLLRQTGTAPCTYEKTWGYDARGIWVSEGCSADFLVGVGDGPGNRPYTSDDDAPSLSNPFSPAPKGTMRWWENNP